MKIDELKTILENRIIESERMKKHYEVIGDIDSVNRMEIDIEETKASIKKLEE